VLGLHQFTVVRCRFTRAIVSAFTTVLCRFELRASPASPN